MRLKLSRRLMRHRKSTTMGSLLVPRESSNVPSKTILLPKKETRRREKLLYLCIIESLIFMTSHSTFDIQFSIFITGNQFAEQAIEESTK